MCNIYDSFESHQKFCHSPEYGPLLHTFHSIIDGLPELYHLEIKQGEGALKEALESPITMLSVLPIAKDKVATFVKWGKEKAPTYLEDGAAKGRGYWRGYPYEDL